MQASQNSFAIKPSAFPKNGGEYTVAGWLDCDMDLLSEHFGVKPSRYTGLGQRGAAFPWRYRTIFLKLPNDSYATLTQHEYRKEQIEVGLRVHKGRIFDEADLDNLQSALPKDAGSIRKIDNGFVWVPAPYSSAGGS
jgi:hypothetical protein